MYLSIKSMLCFVLSLIAMSQVTLEIGSLSKVASMLLLYWLHLFGKSVFFFITQIAVLCWDPSYEHLVVLSLFLISANIRWDVALPPENFSLKHSRIVAKMNGLFGNVIMTVG